MMYWVKNLMLALLASSIFFAAGDLQAAKADKKAKEKSAAKAKDKAKDKTKDKANPNAKDKAQGALAWQNDITKALAEAQKSKKHIIVLITNSESLQCSNLEKGLFAHKRFVSAAKNLVLVKADFPRKKKVAAAEMKLAKAVIKKYPPINRRVPTVYLLDPAGKVLFQHLGYNEESAEKYRTMLKMLKDIGEKDKKGKKKGKK